MKDRFMLLYLKSRLKKFKCYRCGAMIQQGDIACQGCVDIVIEKAWEIV